MSPNYDNATKRGKLWCVHYTISMLLTTGNTPFRKQGNIQAQQVLWENTCPEGFLLNCSLPHGESRCERDRACVGMAGKHKHGVEGPGLEQLTAAGGWEAATCICIPKTAAEGWEAATCICLPENASCVSEVKRRRDKAFGGTVICTAWKNVGRLRKAVAFKEQIFKLKRS